jgi:hypothetical protein
MRQPNRGGAVSAYDITPELDGDMSKSDLAYVLETLRFTRSKDNTCLIRLDAPVRDYLLALLWR